MTNEQIEQLIAERDRLHKECEQLKKRLGKAKEKIRNAKDINPVQRVSLRRVRLLAEEACLTVKRVKSKIEVSLGEAKKRLFKNLREAWEFLSQEEWLLEELFPPPPPPEPPKPERTTVCKYCSSLIYWIFDGYSTAYDVGTQNRHRCDAYPRRLWRKGTREFCHP